MKMVMCSYGLVVALFRHPRNVFLLLNFVLSIFLVSGAPAVVVLYGAQRHDLTSPTLCLRGNPLLPREDLRTLLLEELFWH
jgi:hypothetical protein